MESSQPDYMTLHVKNITTTFFNLLVLTSTTWGVQTCNQIRLVEVNEVGKTTQLRILTGKLEPTAGDVVKSRKD